MSCSIKISVWGCILFGSALVEKMKAVYWESRLGRKIENRGLVEGYVN